MIDETTENIYSQISQKNITIVVEFNGTIAQTQIKAIPGITAVQNISGYIWLIESNTGQDVREDIFNLAVENNIKVLSLQKKENSLEEIFRQLTGNKI